MGEVEEEEGIMKRAHFWTDLLIVGVVASIGVLLIGWVIKGDWYLPALIVWSLGWGISSSAIVPAIRRRFHGD